MDFCASIFIELCGICHSDIAFIAFWGGDLCILILYALNFSHIKIVYSHVPAVLKCSLFEALPDVE